MQVTQFLTTAGRCLAVGLLVAALVAPRFAAAGPPPPLTELEPGETSPQAAWLDRVYRDLLGRPLDRRGLESFLVGESGGRRGRGRIARQVLSSAEYFVFVAGGIYQGFLRRSPNTDQLSALATLLRQRGQDVAIAAVLGSAEYFQGPGGGTNDAFVAALYADLLARPPDSAEAERALRGLTRGGSREQVALALLRTREVDEKLIRSYYQVLLAAPPPPVELQFLSAALQRGVRDEEVLEFIVASPQYFHRAADPLANVWLDRIYTQLLNRTPTGDESARWTEAFEASGSTERVARRILDSSEYRAALVQDLFQQFLKRPAQSNELEFYTRFLAGQGTRGHVAAQLIGSNEYFGGAAGGTNEGFIAALFADVLNRPPDAGEQSRFLRAMQLRVPRVRVATLVLQQKEADEVLVRQWYARLLNRPPAPLELEVFVGQLQGRGAREENVLARLLASEEFFATIDDD